MRLFFCVLFSSVILMAFVPHKKTKSGVVKISFINTIDGRNISLEQKQYINPFGEQYTIDKLRYYISNIELHSVNNNITKEENSYHLINEWGDADSTTNDLSFAVEPDTYKSISFLIGVDSSMNVSGAQSGALDPLNGMFWAWNTGYVMFKMEGHSPSSSEHNKIEYHIGGFSGAANVLRTVTVTFSDNKLLAIKKGNTSEIVIEADINKLWNAVLDLKIATTPVCTTPGNIASAIADNYSKMFSINAINNK